MDKSPLASNPFALMMNPDAVLQAMHRSDRLGRLSRRICKPLDKPLVAREPGDAIDLGELDAGEATTED